MSVKTNVLKTLEENRGFFFSGEELATKLEVSRAAVWKAIKELEKEGYSIDAVPNRGYCLAGNSDIISVEGIQTYLKRKDLPITVTRVTASTNQDAKICAAAGGTHGSLFVTEEQTAGRGRRGRSFVSIKGKSIYMSIILKPQVHAENIVLITTAASVAVYRAIEMVTGKKTQIKWVNDIYYQTKKICGILTEAVTDCESGTIDSVIVGIGINFNFKREAIPEELKDIVGSLFDGDSGTTTRNELIAEVVNQLLFLCDHLEEKEFLEDYKINSLVIGKEVNVIGTFGTKSAMAMGIESNGGLRVKYEDGSQEVLCTGEITIRLRETE